MRESGEPNTGNYSNKIWTSNRPGMRATEKYPER